MVRGRTVTSWPSLRTDLANAGADWVYRQLVVCEGGDSRLITSRQPDDLDAFDDALVTLRPAGARRALDRLALTRRARSEEDPAVHATIPAPPDPDVVPVPGPTEPPVPMPPDPDRPVPRPGPDPDPLPYPDPEPARPTEPPARPPEPEPKPSGPGAP